MRDPLLALDPDLRAKLAGTLVESTPREEGRPDAPDLGSLLGAVERFIRRFVHFQNDHQAVAAALWTAHVYAIAAAPFAAYLRITSATEEAGKTTLLEVLELLLGERCLNAVSATPAAIFRYREKVGPVALLLDEIDQTLRDRKDDGARDLLALVNSGYRRSARALRTVGQGHEPKAFPAFGPCAIAGLGTLHPTTESRCIPIVLERKPRAAGERFLAHLVEDEARELGEHLAAWASEATVERLRAARPELPEELRNRHAEVWWALFAIADEAGGDWPERARRAAVALHASREGPDTMSLGVLLLAHIRQAFEEAGTDRLSTVELLRRLVENEEGPWGRFWGPEVAREETPRAAPADLARYLRQFRTPEGEPIRPRVIKLPDGSTSRGYRVDDFAAALELYLPSPPSGGDVTDVTDVTALASEVTSVTSVTSGSGAEEARPGPEDVLALARELSWPRLERPDGAVVEGAEAWCALVAGADATSLAGLWDHLEGAGKVRAALRPQPRPGPQAPADGCPSCGARSAEPGHGGHAMGCPRFYGGEVIG